MVLVDANILLCAVNESAPRHAQAKAWIEQALSGSEAIGFAWMVLLAFLRLSTLPALFPRPLEPAEAMDRVEEWLAARPAGVVHPTARHARLLRGFVDEARTAGNLVNDAHLAAMAIETGATICSFDRDFARFGGVRVIEPG